LQTSGAIIEPDGRNAMRLRYVLGVCAGSVIGVCAATTELRAEAPAARSRGNVASRPKTDRLTQRVGGWDVVMTLRTAPNAKPIVIAGLIAERTVIGPYLQEIMRPAPSSKVPDFRRIDYLTYNTLQRRWQYLSMDTRAAVGLMFAQGVGSDQGGDDQGGDLTVYFADFPAPTEFGPELAGHFMRARHVLTQESDSREVVRQYWTVGAFPEWVGVQYEYTRRPRSP
jgi:hypothetical protein